MGPISVEELIRQRGYPVETHEIQTEDGYLLTYHRIPQGKNGTASAQQNGDRQSVLLQHGMFCCSAVWLISKHGLGFLLADAGFDVWIANSRGNTYSRKHVKYDPDKDKEQFWNFSWHEMGVYDLPAAIDYILRTTGDSQLSFVGHSMGTTIYFVMGSNRPEYMRKVNAAMILAPVAYMCNVRSHFLKFLVFIKSFMYWLADKFGCYNIVERTHNLNWAAHFVCTSRWLQFILVIFISEIAGFDLPQFDWKHLPLQLDYVPAGSSTNTLKHYLQVIEKGFSEFDYGPKVNILKYGTPEPPAYNLSSVNTPMYVWWAPNDYVVVPQTVELTVAHLPNVKQITKVPDDNFNHLDVIWALDAKTLVYDGVISTLKSLKHTS